MGCGCGGKVATNTNKTAQVPQINNGTNQLLIKQAQEQARQQAEIQKIINPSKTLIKTYR